jgi:hypothetical protein
MNEGTPFSLQQRLRCPRCVADCCMQSKEMAESLQKVEETLSSIFQVSDPNLVTHGDVAEFFLDVGVSRLDVLALGLALGGAEEDVDDGLADDSVRKERVGAGEREPLRDAEGRHVLARVRAVDLGETARVVRVVVRGKHGDRLRLRDGALHVEAFVETVHHFDVLR